MLRDFGTARDADVSWLTSAPAAAPCGLSAVSPNKTSWPTCSLAVVAFPPQARLASRPVWTAFRRPSGTVRPSDFFRPFVISFFRSRRLPLVAFATAEAERSPRVRTQNFVQNRRHYQDSSKRKLGFAESSQLAPRAVGLTALRFRSVPHCTFGLPPDTPSRARRNVFTPPRETRCSGQVPLSLAWGSLRQGPRRTCFSSCRTSTHLLFCAHAGRTARLRLRAPGALSRELRSHEGPNGVGVVVRRTPRSL